MRLRSNEFCPIHKSQQFTLVALRVMKISWHEIIRRIRVACAFRYSSQSTTIEHVISIREVAIILRYCFGPVIELRRKCHNPTSSRSCPCWRTVP
jgi:hypothetical protein